MVLISERQKQSTKRKEICIMRKNKLFKKAIAVIVAACTFVSATGFNGTTVKAASFTTISVDQEVSGSIEVDDGSEGNDYYSFVTDDSDSFYSFNIKGYDGENDLNYDIYSDAEMTEKVFGLYSSSGENNVYDLQKKIKPSTQYYIKINARNMKYKFTIKKYATDDFGDNRTDLNKFEIGAQQCGIINNGSDVDYFTFKTDSSNSFYYFDVKSIDGEIEYKIFSDAEMTEEVFGLYSSGGEAHNYNLEKKLKPSTQYYLQMSGGHEMDQVHYQFSIRKVADDVEDTADKAKRLDLNKSNNQKINNDSDIDCFKFSTSNYIDYNITFKSTTEYGDVDYAIYKDKEMTVLLKSGYLSGKSVLSRNEGTVKLTPYRTYYIKITGKENSKYTIGINAAAPANNKAKAQTVKKTRQVTISWSKVNKATGYEVYRAVKNGSYKKVATIKSAKTVKWIDKKVKKGYTYKYKVRAYAKVKGKTYYSAYSAEKAVKVK